MLLFVLVLPLQGLTQSTSPELHPLRPTDTSSPRDTLRSFLNNANQSIQMWLSGIPLDVLAKRRLRAVETLNFSQVVDPHLVSTQVQHALLLKEVLDRITLPPDDQIPGDQEVKDQGITRWTLPNTRITIAQVQDGPREGEFLFSSRTVKQLEEIYLRAKHLPYKPGATEGIYDKFLEAQGLSATAVAEVRNRLKPVDTSSPRSTYIGFRDSLKQAYRLIMDADAAFIPEPPTISLEEARQVEKEAEVLLRRAISTLDLSKIPKGIRHELGIEVALQLNEVLDRVPELYRDSIPDAEVVLAWKRKNKDVLSITPRPFSWQFPNTEIEIVEVQEGPRTGEFLFSARTVSRAEAFYQTMEDLPYREGATESFYEFFISTPGYLIPDLYPLTRWIDKLPAVFMSMYADQALWQWVGLVLTILAIFVAAGLVFFVIRRLSRRVQEPYKEWLRVLLPIFIALIVLGIPEFVNHGLNITGQVLWIVTEIFDTIVYLMAVWAVFILFKALAETVISSPRIPDQSINANLLRLGARVIGFMVSAWILIKGVQELGVDVLPLLAGLGVVGLAVSLAARPTIENLIAGLILFADKPVRVGDRCHYGGQKIGDIEHIGLRSTRVRSLERTLITIPNAAFSEIQLDNFAARDHAAAQRPPYSCAMRRRPNSCATSSPSCARCFSATRWSPLIRPGCASSAYACLLQRMSRSLPICAAGIGRFFWPFRRISCCVSKTSSPRPAPVLRFLHKRPISPEIKAWLRTVAVKRKPRWRSGVSRGSCPFLSSMRRFEATWKTSWIIHPQAHRTIGHATVYRRRRCKAISNLYANRSGSGRGRRRTKMISSMSSTFML